LFDGNVAPAALIEAATDAGCFVFDEETSGLSPHEDRIEGIAFYVPATKKRGPVRAWYPFVGSTFLVCDKDGNIVNVRDPMPQRETMELLRPLFKLKNVVAIAHNAKFDMAFLRCSSGCVEPIEIENRLADSMIADYLSDERRRRYGLKVRVRQVFGVEMTTYAEAVRGQALLNFMPQKPLGAYAMDDCQWTYELFVVAMNSLRKQTRPQRSVPQTPTEIALGRPLGSLEAIYWGIEMKLVRILMEIETTGILIDWPWLVEVETKLNAKRQELAHRIEDFLGWPCNPRAPQQVVDALFAPPPDGLGLPSVGVPVGKEGLPSTSDKVIKHFKRFHPLVQDILELRSIETVLSGFVRKIRKLAQESFDGRIRTKFNQTGTVIGRLSCIAVTTPVEIVRDVNRHPGGIPIEDVKPGDLAYTFNDDLTLGLRRVLRTIKTGTRSVIRVHWQKSGYRGRKTDGYVDLTPEHPVRMLDGSYTEACLLSVGDRVMALSRSVNTDGYAMLYATHDGAVGREHVFVHETTSGDKVKRGDVVHHKDENKLNNIPTNLEMKPRGMHGCEHAKEQWARLTDEQKECATAALNSGWQRPERHEQHSEQTRQAWKDGKFKKPQGHKHPPYEEITTEWLAAAFEECSNAAGIRKQYGMNHYRLKRVIERLQFVPNNHVITQVEHTGRVVDVYDLEIEGTHNFIAGELCVHNSSDPFNGQNMPRDKDLVRKAFCAHLPGDPDPELVLIGGDYGQIELRVASHLAKEDNMREVFRMGKKCVADNGGPCPRFTFHECHACGACLQPIQVDGKTLCGKCKSADVEHQKRCRHVDLHQRTAEDANVKRNPLAKCLDGSTLVRTVNGVRTIASLIPTTGAPGEHQPLRVCLTDGRGGYVDSSSAIFRHNRPTKIVVTKRAVVIATEDHRFQVIGDYDALDQSTPGYKHVPGLSLVEARSLEKGMKLPVALMGEEGRNQDHAWHDFSDPQSVRLNPFTKEIGDGPAEIILNEDWAYFAGMFHGDGCASGNACVITHGHTDEYEPWRQIVRSACDKLGLPTTLTADKRNTRIGSRIVRRYFAALGLCKEVGKSGQKTVRVPWWVLDGGPKIIWSYIAGLFDTDGTVGKRTGGTASFTTKYPEFAGQIAFLLRELGMPILVQPGFNKTYERWYYTVHVLGEGLDRFQRYCPMRDQDKQVRLTERNETIKRRCAPSDDEVLLVLDGGERTVYDFQVENDDHIYLQGGLLGHNNLNFGLLYRMAAPKFCIYADLFDADGKPMIPFAQEVVARWFAAYPAIQVFHELNEETLPLNDYTATTITGRRRRLYFEYQKNPYRATTQSIQFQVSGSSQDLIKIAMTRIFEERNKKIANTMGAERKAWEKWRFLLQVHDEVLFQCSKHVAPEAAEIFERCMVTADGGMLSVPLECAVRTGRSWDDVH